MASFDEITWSPRIGSSGDDLYNVPGTTKLDNTLDSGNPLLLIYAGLTNPANNTPSDISTKFDYFNQVVAYINYRIRICNATFGSSLAELSYFSPNTKISFTVCTNLLAAINSLLGAEGLVTSLSPLTWPNTTPTQNQPIYGYYLAYLRKALRISGKLTMPLFNFGLGVANNTSRGMFFYQRTDEPYTVLQTEALHPADSSPSNYPFFVADPIPVGKIVRQNGSNWDVIRTRLLFYTKIPTWVAGTFNGTFSFPVESSDTTLETYNANVYASDTDDSGGALGVQNNTNHLLSTIASSAIVGGSPHIGTFNNWTGFDQTHILPRVGSKISLILATAHEVVGDGASTHTNLIGSQVKAPNFAVLPGPSYTPGVRPFLILDFGA